MDGRGCCEHRVFQDLVRSAVHQLRPDPESGGIHGEDIESLGNLFQPAFDRMRLGWILLARELDSGLDLADRDRREVEISVIDAFKPSDDRPMRSQSSQLGDDVRVEQLLDRQAASPGCRRRSPPRFGKCSSARTTSVNRSTFNVG